MNTMLVFAALLSAPLPGPKAPGQSADKKAIKAVHSKLNAAFKAKNPWLTTSEGSREFLQLRQIFSRR